MYTKSMYTVQFKAYPFWLAVNAVKLNVIKQTACLNDHNVRNNNTKMSLCDESCVRYCIAAVGSQSVFFQNFQRINMFVHFLVCFSSSHLTVLINVKIIDINQSNQRRRPYFSQKPSANFTVMLQWRYQVAKRVIAILQLFCKDLNDQQYPMNWSKCRPVICDSCNM